VLIFQPFAVLAEEKSGRRAGGGIAKLEEKGQAGLVPSSLLKKVSGTFKACEKPEIYSTRKVPDTFFNRLLGQDSS
jgi:hypothetical protein